MTVCAHDIALGDLSPQLLDPSQAGMGNRLGDTELLVGPVIEVHHVDRIPLAAVSARHILRRSDDLPHGLSDAIVRSLGCCPHRLAVLGVVGPATWLAVPLSASE